jgi:anti-sigma factor RsiW
MSVVGQAEFLKVLVRYGDAEEKRRLLVRMRRAERQERSSRRALVVSALLAAVCCVGLSYLSRDVLAGLDEVALTLIDAVSGVAAFSAYVLLVVSGCWLWNRGVVHRMEEEATRFVLGMLESRVGRVAR